MRFAYAGTYPDSDTVAHADIDANRYPHANACAGSQTAAAALSSRR